MLIRSFVIQRCSAPWFRTSTSAFLLHFRGHGNGKTPRYENPLNAMRVISGMEEPSRKGVPMGTPPDKLPPNESDGKKEEDDQSLMGRMKTLIRDYGYIFVPVHIVLTAMWFTAIYTTIKSGVDLSEWVKWIGSHEKIARLGPFAASIVCLKLLAPVRFLTTIAVTSMTIRILTRRGVIRSAGEIRGQMQEKYEEQKENLMEKYEERKEKFEEQKENLREKMGEQKESMKERLEEQKENLKEKLEEKKESFKEKFEEQKESLKDKYEKQKENLKKFKDKER